METINETSEIGGVTSSNWSAAARLSVAASAIFAASIPLQPFRGGVDKLFPQGRRFVTKLLRCFWMYGLQDFKRIMVGVFVHSRVLVSSETDLSEPPRS